MRRSTLRVARAGAVGAQVIRTVPLVAGLVGAVALAGAVTPPPVRPVPPVPPLPGGARHDSREVVPADAPGWTRAIGRLRVRQMQADPDGDDEVSWSTGTCTLVARDLVLTAWHVVESEGRRPTGAWSVEFGYREGRCAAMRRGTAIADAVVAHSAEQDWALLRLDLRVPHLTPLSVARAVGTDARLSLAGYSGDDGIGAGGRVLTIDPGCATRTDLERASPDSFRRTRCFAFFGASGGPLLLDNLDNHDNRDDFDDFDVLDAEGQPPAVAAITTRIFGHIPGWTFVVPSGLFVDAVEQAAGAEP